MYTSRRDDPITVFSTRPGYPVRRDVSSMLAPEHPLVDALTTPSTAPRSRRTWKRARQQTEIERLAEDREKTGTFIGACCGIR